MIHKYKCIGIFEDRDGDTHEKEYTVEIDTQKPIDTVLEPEDMATVKSYAQFCYYSFLCNIELLDIRVEEIK